MQASIKSSFNCSVPLQGIKSFPSLISKVLKFEFNLFVLKYNFDSTLLNEILLAFYLPIIVSQQSMKNTSTVMRNNCQFIGRGLHDKMHAFAFVLHSSAFIKHSAIG